MKIGIIGYGSMGKMILEKICQSFNPSEVELYVSNRKQEKITHLKAPLNVCKSNAELADIVDIICVCQTN